MNCWRLVVQKEVVCGYVLCFQKCNTTCFSYVFLCFIFCKMWRKCSPSSLQRKNYLGVKHDSKKDANYPDIEISFHIMTSMWIRNDNWHILSIVILGKHQMRILNAYKYYSIPVLILMSIKLLSSHFRQLHASDYPTFCVWQAVSESLWETILQRRAEAFHNSHGVPIPWNLLEFTSPLSDNTARAQDLSSTIFMCKRTMLIVLDYLNKYG